MFAKLQKATSNYTIPAHLFAKNLAASTLILNKFYIKSIRKMQVWLKFIYIYIWCTLHEGLSVVYIVDSNICSSVIQKRTHCCISMAIYHYLSYFDCTSYSSKMAELKSILTLILLMWRIGWAPNKASKWQMGFNLAFKGLRRVKMWTHHRVT